MEIDLGSGATVCDEWESARKCDCEYNVCASAKCKCAVLGLVTCESSSELCGPGVASCVRPFCVIYDCESKQKVGGQTAE